jgi:hypothetical protein
VPIVLPGSGTIFGPVTVRRHVSFGWQSVGPQQYRVVLAGHVGVSRQTGALGSFEQHETDVVLHVVPALQ